MDGFMSELAKMNIDFQSLDIIQHKDGIVVARVVCEDRSLIIKFFQRQAFAREIENYRILSSLNIPTLHIISATERALLMEDIRDSTIYRFGTEQDLNNPEIAVLIAKWYKLLHHKGYEYIRQNHDVSLYDENDLITAKNIEEIKRKTNTSALPVWKLIERNLDLIQNVLSKVKRTLTYIFTIPI